MRMVMREGIVRKENEDRFEQIQRQKPTKP
jgi:hypothetical protein